MELTIQDRLRTATKELFGVIEFLDEYEIEATDENDPDIVSYDFVIRDYTDRITKIAFDVMDEDKKYAVWALAEDDDTKFDWYFLYELRLEDGVGKVEFVTEGI